MVSCVLRQQADRRSDCVPLVNTVGQYFQILDDYKNLSSATYTVNKGLAEDLEEGKFSFPIIHSIRSDPSNTIVLNILKQKPKDTDVKRYAISHMEKTGSFAYSRKVLKSLEEEALKLVEQMESAESSRGAGAGVRAILERLRVEEEKLPALTNGTPEPTDATAGREER